MTDYREMYLQLLSQINDSLNSVQDALQQMEELYIKSCEVEEAAE